MSEPNEISIKLSLDSDLQKEMERERQRLETENKKVESSFNGISKAVSAVGAAIAGAFTVAKITQFGIESVRAYDDSEMAAIRLKTALGGTSESLLNLASARQEETRFEDDATVSAEAILATYGLTEKQILRLIPAIQDMSAATGDDLVAASDKVGRSIGTTMNALQREGIHISDSTSKAQRLSEVIAQLSSRYEGQAVAAGNVGAGGVVKLKNSFGDLMENVGQNIVEFPLFSAAVEGANNVLTIAKRITSTASTEYKQLAEDIQQETIPPILDLNEALINTVKLTPSVGVALGSIPHFADPDKIKEIAESFKFVAAEADATVVNTTESVNRIREAIAKDASKPNKPTTDTAQANEPIVEGMPYSEWLKKRQEYFAEIRAGNELKTQLAQSQLNEEYDYTERTFNREMKLFDEKAARYEETAQAMGAALASGIGKGSEGLKETLKSVLNVLLSAVEKEILIGFVGAGTRALLGDFSGLLGMAGVAAAFEAAKAGVAAFATGGDFVTNGPQFVMVGDNPGGRERVQVTPLSSPNVNGPSGRSLNINFNIAPGATVNRNDIVQVIESATKDGLFDNAFRFLSIQGA